MRVAIVTELKPQEGRVALTPTAVDELVDAGHEVLVEAGAGDAAGFTDDDFAIAGATVVDADTAWSRAELVVKVKEPMAVEYRHFRPDLILCCFLHLAADRPLTEALLEAGTLGIALETVRDADGLPVLTAMSEIAGRLAASIAATQLTSPAGGPGLLIGGVPGVAPCRVLIIGGGTVGAEAARIAAGMHAEVTVLDIAPARIRHLEHTLPQGARVLRSDARTLESELASADVVIGAVLVPGQAAPRVLRRAHLALLRPGTLLVDIAIDQGGSFETSRPTTHAEPTFVVDGITHYCVTNIPGSVARTSSQALSNAALPYVRRLADLGAAAVDQDAPLASGVNVRAGRVVHPGVAATYPDLPRG